MIRKIGMGLAVFVLVAAGAYLLTRQFTEQASPQGEVVAPPTIPTLESVSDIPVPPLPFADNPDPTACGAPLVWGGDGQAWLTGYYEGELVAPTVYLYDSHLRKSVTGLAPTGTTLIVWTIGWSAARSARERSRCSPSFTPGQRTIWV